MADSNQPPSLTNAGSAALSSQVDRWLAGKVTLAEVRGYSSEELTAIAEVGFAYFAQGKYEQAAVVFDGLAAVDIHAWIVLAHPAPRLFHDGASTRWDIRKVPDVRHIDEIECVGARERQCRKFRAVRGNVFLESHELMIHRKAMQAIEWRR